MAWSCGLQHYFKLPRLSSELIDESYDSESPCATYLHRINQTKHCQCCHCCAHCSQDGSQKEILLHFLSICPKFHFARTAEHNQVCKVLATSL